MIKENDAICDGCVWRCQREKKNPECKIKAHLRHIFWEFDDARDSTGMEISPTEFACYMERTATMIRSNPRYCVDKSGSLRLISELFLLAGVRLPFSMRELESNSVQEKTISFLSARNRKIRAPRLGILQKLSGAGLR